MLGIFATNSQWMCKEHIRSRQRWVVLPSCRADLPMNWNESVLEKIRVSSRLLSELCFMANAYMPPNIDEYLRDRLMPVEGAIPHLPGIDMYGNSIPAGTVGGDLFEYINFQQRYDFDARIRDARRLSAEYRQPNSPGAPGCNSVDDGMELLKSRPE